MTKKIVINIFVFLVILLTIISSLIYFNSKKIILEYDKNIEVFLNQELFNTENIKIKNGKILTSKELIDTSKIGEQEIVLEIQDYFKRKKSIKYLVNVKDDEGPKITCEKVIEVEIGNEINLIENVLVVDNSNEEIIPTIKGEYDINKIGEYNLSYVAIDRSGNKTEENFTLKVKEKEIKKDEDSKNNLNNNQTFTTSKGFKGIIKDGITYINGYLIVNKTYSLPSNFGSSLTKETMENFTKMQNAATLEGLNIYISSGFRSYDTQKKLYNNYVKRDGVEAADTYSARAGHSEHQSGLAFDVNIINDTFANTPEAKWLSSNCYKYGFILRYPKGKTNETGYKYESWHFRYVGEELATKLYNNGNWITMENYFGITSQY